MCFFFCCLRSKQAWLWAEGDAHRKKCAIVALPKHKFGIYSIRQREESERLTCRQPSSVSTSSTTTAVTTAQAASAMLRDDIDSRATAVSVGTERHRPILRDRVQKISQKVVTMTLSDGTTTTTTTTTVSTGAAAAAALKMATSDSDIVIVDDNSDRDENKNRCTIDVRPVAHQQQHHHHHHSQTVQQQQQPYGVVTTVASNPTQGDTLNQIKAMRRRHSRSVNISGSL